MSSIEAKKGLLTFLLLLGIFSTAYIGFNLSENMSQVTDASSSKKPFSNLEISKVSSSEATITWETKDPVITKAAYSTVDDGCEKGKSCEIYTKDDLPRIKHEITLKNLNENTTYYLFIKIKDFNYPAKPVSFKTK